MTNQQLLLGIIAVLLAAIGYFIKQILNNTNKISADVSDMKPKVKVLWELQFAGGKSPLTLNERGLNILNKSGIKELVDNALSQFLDEIQEKNPINTYEVQELSRQVMLNIKNNPNILPKLQEWAFNAGVDVDAVLFVGSLYLRDLVLPKFNFKLEDIDSSKPDK